MVTSSTSVFNPMATFIMTSAYRKLGVIDENEVPTAGMFTDALYALNSLTKEWMASGIHVWTEQEAILFLQPNQARYLIGGTSTDNTSDQNSWTLLTLSSSAVAGASSIVVTSASGVTVGQNLGVVLDNGTTQWTTVKSIVGTTINFATGVTISTSASAGNNAFVYTTRIVRPLKVPRARRYAFAGTLETPMNVFSRKEYMNLPNKVTPGTPTSFFYNPQLVSGELFIWPVPNNAQSAIRLTWYRPLQDWSTPDNTADLPSEWINSLTWNLALELAPDFSIPQIRYQMIQQMAMQKLEDVRGWDREAQPIYFTISTEQFGDFGSGG